MDENDERTYTVDCPTCGAPVGEPCRALPGGWHMTGNSGQPLKDAHLHRLRIVADEESR